MKNNQYEGLIGFCSILYAHAEQFFGQARLNEPSRAGPPERVIRAGMREKCVAITTICG